MKKNILYIVLLSFILLSCSKEIELENKKWSYENGNLKFSFTIKNNGYIETNRNIHITAYTQKKIGRGAIVSDIIGDKIITVYLPPHEERKVEDSIKLLLNQKPTSVVFNYFEAK